MIGEYGANDVFSWNDGFVYQATGMPSVTFSASGSTIGQRYHTDYDTLGTLDFPSLEPVLAAEAEVALDLDDRRSRTASTGAWRASRAASTRRPWRTFGGDATGVWAAYERLAAAWNEAKTEPYSACSIAAFRTAVNTTDDRLTALFLGEGTSYPHQQAEMDIVGLSDAISALGAGRWRRCPRCAVDGRYERAGVHVEQGCATSGRSSCGRPGIRNCRGQSRGSTRSCRTCTT